MGCYRASKKVYLNRQTKQQEQVTKNAVDTNVVEIRFDDLIEKAQKIHQGDPIICQECNSILNKYSVLQDSTVDGYNQLWICEFCGKDNLINIEKEEIPTNEDVVYLVESVEENEQKQDKNGIQIADNSVLYCIDLSGSMDIHRKYVVPALEKSVKDVFEKNNNQKVGLVTFDEKVTLIGDCTKDKQFIRGDELNNRVRVQEISTDAASQMMKIPIKLQYLPIQNTIRKFYMSGSTALGPALLSSIEFAKQGSQGSMIILCTDGLANVGLGRISANEEEALKFYQEMGDYAAKNGIVIQVITIKGSSCRLDILNHLADRTNGNVLRIDAKDMENQLQNVFKDEILATQTELIVKLHKGLKFRHEDNQTSTLTKNIGNATIETVFTAEYQLRNLQELKELDIDILNLKKIPFQVRTNYQNFKGDKFVWVTTHQVDTTERIEEAQKEVDLKVIQKRVAQQTVHEMETKGASKAIELNLNWTNFMKNDLKEKEDSQFLQKNQRVLRKVEKHSDPTKKEKKQKKSQREQEEESDDDDYAEFQKFKKAKY